MYDIKSNATILGLLQFLGEYCVLEGFFRNFKRRGHPAILSKCILLSKLYEYEVHISNLPSPFTKE